MKGAGTEKMRAAAQRTGLKWWLIGFFGKGLIDLVGRTMKIRIIDFEKVKGEISSKRFILAFWHSRIVVVSYMFTGWDGIALVSRSEDGEIISQILQRQGHETIRGSTSRHGVRALAQLIKKLKEKVRPVAMIPDGPRGPRFKAQPGVITLAQKTRYPIVPVSYSAKRLKVFSSWDRFILPYPFNHGCLIYGNPLIIPYKLKPEAREVYRVKLEKELNRITKEADEYYNQLGE